MLPLRSINHGTIETSTSTEEKRKSGGESLNEFPVLRRMKTKRAESLNGRTMSVSSDKTLVTTFDKEISRQSGRVRRYQLRQGPQQWNNIKVATCFPLCGVPDKKPLRNEWIPLKISANFLPISMKWTAVDSSADALSQFFWLQLDPAEHLAAKCFKRKCHQMALHVLNEFAAERFVQSKFFQKGERRAFQQLSTGVK